VDRLVVARTLLIDISDMGSSVKKSPLPHKRMHRKGGGRGELAENVLEGRNSSINGWRPGK